jgi:hypothetical protein
MRSVPGQVIGPGHHSIVTSPEGVDYAVYHAWNEAMTDRQMCVDRLDWIDGVPSITRFAGAGSALSTLCRRVDGLFNQGD